MNKTMLKLVWSITMFVLLVGLMRLAFVWKGDQSNHQKILIRKSK